MYQLCLLAQLRSLGQDAAVSLSVGLSTLPSLPVLFPSFPLTSLLLFFLSLLLIHLSCPLSLSLSYSLPPSLSPSLQTWTTPPQRRAAVRERAMTPRMETRPVRTARKLTNWTRQELHLRNRKKTHQMRKAQPSTGPGMGQH